LASQRDPAWIPLILQDSQPKTGVHFSAILPREDRDRHSEAALARNVSAPFGTPYKTFGVYNSEHRSVANLTNRLYLFELTTAPTSPGRDLKKMELSPALRCASSTRTRLR
jgi:hypothetical protein